MSTLSAVYGRVARVRRSWYERRPHRRRALAQPVVSIGNLVVGGSGKTPLVVAVARLLLAHGEVPVVLSRGYGRRRGGDGVVVVSDRARVLEPVDRSGDEPQMLAHALPGVPILVADDRHLAGRLGERRFGATVHVLDDGFQHLRLTRDVDLLLVHPEDLDDRVLPAGRLREPLDAAGAADAVIVPGSPLEAEEVGAALGVRTTFTLERRYLPARWLAPAAAPAPAPTRVVAVTGIAQPARFAAALRDLGWDVAREMTFPDHHWFTDRDLDRVSAAVRETGADGAITTEKDAVRLGALRDRPGPLWAVLPMEVAIEPAGRFEAWLLDRIRAHPSRTER